MFTAEMSYFKVYQDEMLRRADHHRLLKTLQGSESLISQLSYHIGRMLVSLGRQLVEYTQPAQ
jgi:hypothetical protein